MHRTLTRERQSEGQGVKPRCPAELHRGILVARIVHFDPRGHGWAQRAFSSLSVDHARKGSSHPFVSSVLSAKGEPSDLGHGTAPCLWRWEGVRGVLLSNDWAGIFKNLHLINFKSCSLGPGTDTNQQGTYPLMNIGKIRDSQSVISKLL